jgi:lipid kinase YegS
MPMRSMRLILHGKAAADPAVREAVEALREIGQELDVRVTWESGQATVFAREAAEAGIEVVVAGGGDGLTNEVVRGILSSDKATLPALALLPLGTANDLARSLGTPIDDPWAALKLASEGVASQVDVGMVNERPFINVASGGFGAEITVRTPPELKNALGGAAYSITGLFTASELKPVPCQLLAAGQTLEISIALMAIGNGRQAGGGFAVAPEARLNDGLLDLMIVPAVPLANLPQLVGELFKVSAAENQHILYWQLPELEMHFADEFLINLDGEPMRARDFHCRVLPGRLSAILPVESAG